MELSLWSLIVPTYLLFLGVTNIFSVFELNRRIYLIEKSGKLHCITAYMNKGLFAALKDKLQVCMMENNADR